MKRLSVGAVAALLLLGLVAPPASAASESLPDISSSRIHGSEAEGRLGQSLDGAGDFNGDGSDDLVVGGDERAFVILGGAPGDITAGDQRSIELTTALPERRQTLEVAGAGDIDGDGFGDILVGIESADPMGRRDAGSVFLVFGRQETTPIILDAADVQNVVRIDGAAKGDHAGTSVAAAGDVNGDGISDIVLGARLADDGTGKRRGAAYVLSGRALTTTIDLNDLGDRGFTIRSPSFGRSVGASVGRAGDMNADGFDDVIVGAPSSLVIAPPAVYVVFGSASTDDVILGSLGDGGFLIKAGENERQGGAGEAVSGGHDVNGDGRPDVIVGAPGASGRFSGGSGAAYVIFGRSSSETIRLGRLGDDGFEVQAGEESYSAGESVALIPDLSGDGLADILVGAPEERSGYGSHAVYGAVYHLVGQTGTEEVDLGRLGSDGVRYRGGEGYDLLGASVAVVGDFDGDGAQDLAVGAPRANAASADDAGMAYVFTPVEAPAFDNPPAAELLSYNTRQRAERGSYCWDGRCVDKMPSFPKRDLAGAGDEARFRISFSERPEGFSLTGYRERDEFGRPSGPGMDFTTRLQPVRNYGGASIAGYEAIFNLPKQPGDLYLVGAASWPGENRGDASWFAHVKLSKAAAYSEGPGSPPDATLIGEGGTRQEGETISYCWSESYSDGTGSTLCVDGFRVEPRRAEPAEAGTRAFIRIHTRFRPDKVSLRFRREGSSGYPSGDSTKPDYRLRAHRRDGETRAWDVIFRLPNRAGHLDPSMYATWNDHGTAPYEWRLRLR